MNGEAKMGVESPRKMRRKGLAEKGNEEPESLTKPKQGVVSLYFIWCHFC